MHSKSFIRLSHLFTISVLSLVLAGCFGTGDGTPSGPPVGKSSGKLVFSDVEGVTFKTATQEGFTNSRSEFSCLPGETITFAIGDIGRLYDIGSAPCAAIITAVQLTGSSSPADTRVARLLSFIYSLDEDKNHRNGVVITQNVRDWISSYGLPLNLASGTFQDDLDDLITFLNAGVGISLARVGTGAALDAFCFDTYLPGGGSGVFGFPFDGCLETQTSPEDQELLQNGGFEGSFAFIDDPEGVGQGFIPQGWDSVLNFALDCVDNIDNTRCAGGGQTIENYRSYCENPEGFDPDVDVDCSNDISKNNNSMRLFGPTYFIKFFPEPEVTGAYQDIDVVGGETYTASIMAQNLEGSLFSPNFLLLSLIFSTDGDFEDGFGEYAVELEAGGEDDPESGRLYLPPDEWTRMAVSATTTPDTVKARFQILHLQFPKFPADSVEPFPLGDPGRSADVSSVYIDSASLIGPKVEFPPDEYTERWFDDFDGSYDWRDNLVGNPNYWQPEFAYQPPGTGPDQIGWGNKEWQYYSDDPDVLKVEDGILKITAVCGEMDGDEVLPESAGGSALFANSSFEEGAVNGLPLTIGWDSVGTNTLATVSSFTGPGAEDGSFELLQSGIGAQAYQDIAVVAGEEVAALVYAQNWGFANSLTGTARVKLLFLDGASSQLALHERVITPVAGGGDFELAPTLGNPEDWTLVEISEIAPAGAVTARIQLEHDGVTGGIYWDSALLGDPPVECNPGTRDESIFSARINTVESLSDIKYGKIEARMKVPAGLGAWPAFWMLGSSSLDGVNWPIVGEIDIMELWTPPSANNFGANKTTTHATLHWCNEDDPDYDPGLDTCYTNFLQGGHASEGGSASLPAPGLGNLPLDEEFYIYSVEWNPRRFLFKIRENEADVGVTVFERDIDDTMEEFNKPFYMILNLAMGGTLGSNQQDPTTANSEFPQTLEVDWVRVSEIAPKF